MASNVGAGIDRYTGKTIVGWPHVVQSVEVIFSTQIGERVMVREFGAGHPVLLGRAMTPDNVLRFFTLIVVALELWEPRFKITRVLPQPESAEQARLGRMSFVIEGEYRPRAHLGDPTPEDVGRRIAVSASDAAFRAESV